MNPKNDMQHNKFIGYSDNGHGTREQCDPQHAALPSLRCRILFAVVIGLALILAANSGAIAQENDQPSQLTTRNSQLATHLNWQPWEELPVFFDGRVMPLTTFARVTVTAVCGRSSPTFELDESVIDEAKRDSLLDEGEITRLHAKFPNGKRRFNNAELVFSWLVEPEIWEYIPFLDASDIEFQASGIRLRDSGFSLFRSLKPDARSPNYVSPYQVKKHAMDLQRAMDQWKKVEANRLDDAEIEKLSIDGLAAVRSLGPKVVKLQDSYSAYRALINEANALPVYDLGAKLSHAGRQVRTAYQMQLALDRQPVDFSQLGQAVPFERGELAAQFEGINGLLEKIQQLRFGEASESVTAQTLEAELERLLVEFDRLLPDAVRFRDAMFALQLDALPRNAGINAERFRMMRTMSEQLQYSLLQSRQWCEAAYLSLYDNGGSTSRSYALQIFPALVAESIKTDRSYPVQSGGMYASEYSESSRMPTWLTLHTFLYGSDAMIRRFAYEELQVTSDERREAMHSMHERLARWGYDVNFDNHNVIRSTFNDMSVAYINLENSEALPVGVPTSATDRMEQIQKFNTATIFFAAFLRDRAERVTELRRNLVPPELRDNDLLAKTGYPSKSLMRAEYNYERRHPFYWMWVTSAASLTLLLASAVMSPFDRKRRIVEASLFWCGFAMLMLSEVVTLTGACYRAYITGWAPVTNMFETIVLLAFSVAAIGIWFTFQPLFGERLARAWRVAALPRGTSSGYFSDDERHFVKWQLILMPVRVILAIVTLYYILLLSYGEASGGQLSWEVLQHGIAIKDPIDLTVVIISVALLVWLVPRTIITLLVFPFVGFRLQTSGFRLQDNASTINPEARSPKPEACYDRKLFLIVGATLALLAGLAAYFGNSMFSPNIRPLMAVLRSNFWLTVHVFAIIIGYASGAIAWLLAVIACGMCIVGRWHTKRLPNGKTVSQMPDRAEALMPYIMSMLRWTVLLVAVGTILGARWADYSWGRFWGWDPKEVWALVTLMYYLIVLHGRVARYYGNFGVMLGALFGSIAIIMTWYGANVIFKSGRHAYGGADTGFETKLLFVFIIVNLVWGLIAVMRLIVQKAAVLRVSL